MPYSLPHVPHIPQNMLALNGAKERTNEPAQCIRLLAYILIHSSMRFWEDKLE